jgi:hypothetical protein
LLYIDQAVKPMEAAIVENLSNLMNFVLTYVSTLMIAGGVNILLVIAVVLILVLLVARIIKRKRHVLKAFGAQSTAASGRFFSSQRSPALKPCPNCGGQLPLSAIICDHCEYNFLAQRPGRGQKLLPSGNP